MRVIEVGERSSLFRRLALVAGLSLAAAGGALMADLDDLPNENPSNHNCHMKLS